MATKRPKNDDTAKVSATEERRKKARAAAKRKKLVRRAIWVGVVIVIVLIVVAVALVSHNRKSAAIASMTSGSCTYDTKSDPGSEHVTDPTYSVDPPAGGKHIATPAPAGDFSTGSVPAEGMLVHSLEHGYIDIWYQPTIPAAELKQLQSFYQANPRDVLLIPRASIPTPVAATAWHKRLLCQSYEPEAFQTFFDQYVNKGPEAIAH